MGVGEVGLPPFTRLSLLLPSLKHVDSARRQSTRLIRAGPYSAHASVRKCKEGRREGAMRLIAQRPRLDYLTPIYDGSQRCQTVKTDNELSFER
ncbi:hypothetical protein TcWFU_004868 [Taenia crassiceps]|uniref:Uncharacterized protein n=1 Tax=Taenia crassiceps TaxID=6207 RepID=A0ABR4QGQ4_9CEST